MVSIWLDQFVLRPETRFWIGSDRISISRGMQIIRGMFLGGRNISHSHCSRLAVGIALDWVWEFESSVMHNHLGRGPKQFGNWQPWQKFPRYCVLQFASGASEEKGKCIGYSTIVFVWFEILSYLVSWCIITLNTSFTTSSTNKPYKPNPHWRRPSQIIIPVYFTFFQFLDFCTFPFQQPKRTTLICRWSWPCANSFVVCPLENYVNKRKDFKYSKQQTRWVLTYGKDERKY